MVAGPCISSPLNSPARWFTPHREWNVNSMYQKIRIRRIKAGNPKRWPEYFQEILYVLVTEVA
jgi:hypothetical protein